MAIIIHNTKIFVEMTLAIIKPDAFPYAREIESIIKKNHFHIISKRKILLTPDRATDFYAEHYGKPYFSDIVAFMSSGPIVVLVLSAHNAIQKWKHLMGSPKSARNSSTDCLRGRYGKDDTRNALHGSENYSVAEREIHFFFPHIPIEPIPHGHLAIDYLNQTISVTLLEALTHLCKEKPEEPLLWLADYLDNNNPYKPKINVENATEYSSISKPPITRNKVSDLINPIDSNFN
ncbi:hypothetical protein SNEBB_003798 [Seison nebaliae]|nr:hypothetical protein SNEBB_003798 [Seison nebaliae]